MLYVFVVYVIGVAVGVLGNVIINALYRSFTIQEVFEAGRAGRLIEAFGAGTAAIVSPIESITYKDEECKVPIDASLGSGKLTKVLTTTTQRCMC